ncbi:zinc finger protein, partial [Oryctes borbonicus]
PELELKDKGDSLECAVCLQTCIHPAQLPCGHIFCFLCIKGIANQSKKCAMCRQEIPRDFIEHPNLLHADIVSEITTNYDGTYQWFYEGRNGWWRYDDRTSEDIEEAFEMNLKQFQILICGELYIIDLEAKVQYPKRDSSRKRSIKRDLKDAASIGVAGLK